MESEKKVSRRGGKWDKEGRRDRREEEIHAASTEGKEREGREEKRDRNEVGKGWTRIEEGKE